MIKTLSEKGWPIRVLGVFQYFYLLIAILILFVLIVQSFAAELLVGLFLPAIIASLVAYGIYNKKSWIVILITFMAAWGIIANILSPASITLTLISILFLSFEIYFFNRKDVRAHFGLKGTTLF